MSSPKLNADPPTEAVSHELTPTKFLSRQTPTGAPALSVGTNQMELARLVEGEAKRALSAAGQKPTEPKQ